MSVLSSVRITGNYRKLQETVEGSEVILSTISEPVIIDGYADDWPDNRIRQYYDSENALRTGLNNTKISFELSSFYQAGSLILLLDITDDRLYQTQNPVQSPTEGDHLRLSFGDIGYIHKQYIVTSNSPGWLSVIPVDKPDLPETRIQAEMQTRVGGYTIEIAIPDYIAGHYVTLQVVVRDNDDSARYAVIGNAPATEQQAAGLLFEKSANLNQFLKTYRAPAQRLSLLDARGNILATDGDIFPVDDTQNDDEVELYSHIRRLLLIADAIVGEPDRAIYRMTDDYVFNAMNNQSDHIFTRDEQGRSFLSAALPIKIDNQLEGVLVIQQSTEAITGVRHQALLKITLTSISAMGLIILVLLIYATILIKRIRSLNDQMQISATDDGRVNSVLEFRCLMMKLVNLTEVWHK